MKKNRNTAKLPTAQDRYLGDRIREARISNGMSQEDLGELIGVSYQQVQKYEDGKNRVNGGRINQLVTALNRPLNYFFPGATDIRFTADPQVSALMLSKRGQALARSYSRLSLPDQQLAFDVISRLAQEKANG